MCGAFPPLRTPDAPGHRLSVLIVDSHPDAAASLADLVRRWGHAPTVAATGADALRAGAARPDVVFLELRLPDLDGCEVVRRLRNQAGGRRPLFVAVTTCEWGDDRRAVEAGIDLHLVKPADPADLLAVLRRFARLLTPPEPA